VVQAAGRFLKREFKEADSRRYAAEALKGLGLPSQAEERRDV
jgi:hypothetical protein